MADPLSRWLADDACRAPVLHRFEIMTDRSGAGRDFRCARCGIEAGYAVVVGYRLGVEAAGGDGRSTAPLIKMPGNNTLLRERGYKAPSKPWQELERKGWSAR